MPPNTTQKQQPIIKSPQRSNPSSPFGASDASYTSGVCFVDDGSDGSGGGDDSDNARELSFVEGDSFEDEAIDPLQQLSLSPSSPLPSEDHTTNNISLSSMSSLKSPQSILSAAEMIILEALRIIPSTNKEYRDYFTSLAAPEDSTSSNKGLLGTAILSALITPEIHSSLKDCNWRFPLDENLISLLQRLLTHRLIDDDQQVDLVLAFLSSRIKSKNISSALELKLVQFYLSGSTSTGRPIRGVNLRLSLLRLAETFLHTSNTTNRNASKAAITQIIHELMDKGDCGTSDEAEKADCKIIFSWLCTVIRNAHCPPALQVVTLTLCSYVIRKHPSLLFDQNSSLKGQIRESLLPTMIGPLHLQNPAVLQGYLKVLEAFFWIPAGGGGIGDDFPFQSFADDVECVSIFLIRIFGSNLKGELKDPFRDSLKTREVVLREIPVIFKHITKVFCVFDRRTDGGIPFVTELLPRFLYNCSLGIKKASSGSISSSKYSLLLDSVLQDITAFLLKSSNILGDQDGSAALAASSASAVDDADGPDTNTVYDLPGSYEEIYSRRTRLSEIITLFNAGNQIKALDMAIEEGFAPETTTTTTSTSTNTKTPMERKILFLRNTRNLCKGMIGELIGDPRNTEYLKEFIKSFRFENLSFVGSLRALLQSHRIPGESQVIGRILECFANHMVACRPIIYKGQEDLLFQISFSTLMLNTDMYNEQVKKKMTRPSFISNTLRAIGDPPSIGDIKDSLEEILSGIYDELQQEEIVLLGSFSEYPSLFVEGFNVGYCYNVVGCNGCNVVGCNDDGCDTNSEPYRRTPVQSSKFVKEMIADGEMIELLARASISTLFFLYNMSLISGDGMELEWRSSFPTSILPQSLKNLGDLIDIKEGRCLNFILQKLFLIPLAKSTNSHTKANNQHNKKILDAILDWTANLSEEYSSLFDCSSWECILKHKPPTLAPFSLPSPIVPLLQGISLISVEDQTNLVSTYCTQVTERITTCDLEHLLTGTSAPMHKFFSLLKEEMSLFSFPLLERIGHELPLLLVSDAKVLGEYLSTLQRVVDPTKEEEVEGGMEILVHIALLMVQTHLSLKKNVTPISDQDYFTLWFPPLQAAFELGGQGVSFNYSTTKPALTIINGFVEILEQQGKWMGPAPWKVVWKGYLFPLLDSYKDYIVSESSCGGVTDAKENGKNVKEDSLIESIESFMSILRNIISNVINPSLSLSLWFSDDGDDYVDVDDDNDNDNDHGGDGDGDCKTSTNKNNTKNNKNYISNKKRNSDGDLQRLLKELLHHSATVPSLSDRKNTPYLLIFSGIFIEIIPALLKFKGISEDLLCTLDDAFAFICRWEIDHPTTADFSLFTRHCGAHLLLQALLKDPSTMAALPFPERLLSIIRRSHGMAKRFNQNIPLREEMVMMAFAPSLDSMLLTKQECGALALEVEVLFRNFESLPFWNSSEAAIKRVICDIGGYSGFGVGCNGVGGSDGAPQRYAIPATPIDTAVYHKVSQSKCWIELGLLVIEEWSSLLERGFLLDKKVEMSILVMDLLDVSIRKLVLQSYKAVQSLSSSGRSSNVSLASSNITTTTTNTTATTTATTSTTTSPASTTTAICLQQVIDESKRFIISTIKK